MLILVLWMAVPAISAWLRAVSWRGYNAQKDYYYKGGMNPKEAIQQLQQLEQTHIQAGAIENAGRTIGHSITRSLADFALDNANKYWNHQNNK